MYFFAQTAMVNKILVEKIHSAILDMMKRVEFVDNKKIKHAYIVKETGEYLQGVSTVSSILPKDWLSAWGAKECAKFLGYSDYDGEEDILHAEEVIKKIIENERKEANGKLIVIGLENPPYSEPQAEATRSGKNS